MISLLWHFWQKNLRDIGRGPWQVLLAEALTALSALVVYYFTSKALGPAVNYGGDYFLFLVVGEAALFIPLAMWNGVVTQVKNGAGEGTLELWMTLPNSMAGLMALQTLALVPREAFRFLLVLLLAYGFFGLKLSLAHAACVFLVGMASLPLFLAGGMVAASFVLISRRGLTAIAQLGGVFTVLAGAYFPLSSLPPSVKWLSQNLSPFTWTLQLARDGAARGATAAYFEQLGGVLALGAVACVAAAVVLEVTFNFLRRRGEPLLFSE